MKTRYKAKETVNPDYKRLGLVAKVTDYFPDIWGKDIAFFGDFATAERVAELLNAEKRA